MQPFYIQINEQSPSRGFKLWSCGKLFSSLLQSCQHEPNKSASRHKTISLVMHPLVFCWGRLTRLQNYSPVVHSAFQGLFGETNLKVFDFVVIHNRQCCEVHVWGSLCMKFEDQGSYHCRKVFDTKSNRLKIKDAQNRA